MVSLPAQMKIKNENFFNLCHCILEEKTSITTKDIEETPIRVFQIGPYRLDTKLKIK